MIFFPVGFKWPLSQQDLFEEDNRWGLCKGQDLASHRPSVTQAVHTAIFRSRMASMTQATKICQHRNYELKCSAKVLDNGEYVPLLVITKQVWPTRPREIAVRRGDYTTAEAAVEAAYAQGLEWIANYG